MRLLRAFRALGRRLDQRPEVRRALGSSGWLIADRAVRALLEVTVGLWMARTLGPEDFGHLSYALALAALVGPLTSLGLQGIVVRDLVRLPEGAAATLGASLGVRLLGGAASFLVLWTLSGFVTPAEPVRGVLLRIVAVGVLFQAFEVFDFWYQATDRIRWAAAARSGAALAASGVRVALILSLASVAAFAWAWVLEIALWAAGLVTAYLLCGGPLARLEVRGRRARELLAQSWPLLLSGFGAMLNLRVDQVMLGEMTSAGELGSYSAAVRLSEALYMLPNLLIVAVFPAIIRARERGEGVYRQRMLRLWGLAAWLALGCSLAVSLAATTLVPALLGAAFRTAGPILALHVWAFVFVALGAVLSRWLINEGLLVFSFLRHGLGAAVNIGLNLALIPVWGGLGAAAATLASYAVASYGACWLYRPTRPAATMMTQALFAPLAGVRRERRDGGA